MADDPPGFHASDPHGLRFSDQAHPRPALFIRHEIRNSDPTKGVNGMSRVDYDQIAREYDQRYKLHDYHGIRATLHELIKGAQKPKVLEVGCGTGKWLRSLAQAGCTVSGLDASEEMLKKARLDLEADLRNGSAENLPWPGGSVDF
ncbi:MAG: class I SAM-dependent methyltransferase, partial [Desulfobacteraceae bacterium]